jgi:hypothetical protein
VDTIEYPLDIFQMAASPWPTSKEFEHQHGANILGCWMEHFDMEY